jgi:ribosomal protein S18 acetylase RimI-like enzyme
VSVALRAPSIDEAEAIARLHIACWREAYAGIVPAEALASADLSERTAKWQQSIGDADSFVLAAFEDGEPVALMLARPRSDADARDGEGEIGALYVRASHYRMKLGSRLMGAAARWWLARGGRSLRLGVLTENSRAVAFYERIGGRSVMTTTYPWGGADLPHLIYIYDDLPALAAVDTRGDRAARLKAPGSTGD